MTIGVKICGIRDEAVLDAALDAGADWIGLVFFGRSPRVISPERAKQLAARARGRSRIVGLFVDPTDDALARVLDAVALDVLQLYAPAPRVDEIHARTGLPVWRAHGIAERADLPASAGEAERLVIESRPGPERPGGNGRSFDWSLTQGWNAPAHWMLAGGLTPANVGEAIRRSGTASVDVSSGVETAPGEKDPALVRAFVAAARRVDGQ